MIWLIVLAILILIIAGINLYIRFNPQFGARPSKKDIKRYAQSPYWKDGKFMNLVNTTMSINLKTLPGLLRKQFTGRTGRAPKQSIPILPFDHNKYSGNSDQPKFVWYGHSVLLLQIKGKNLLIDPMLGPDASPVGPITTRRFSQNSLDIINQLPKIDAVLLTHDHYDHLDLKSIEKLMPKVDTYLVGLGVGRHLMKWGVPASQITEFDWWDDIFIFDLTITYTPSRHFSGRGTTDRAKSLWGGWTIKSAEHNIYWSGDGGYGDHFKTVGDKLGPFDIAFMECGQYNELWHQIHMYPEESVLAAIDAKAKQAVAVHWAGFTLALHNWTDPIERFVAEAELKGYPFQTPQIGEVIEISSSLNQNKWWLPYI